MSKMVEMAPLRGVRQAKERKMPTKPKPEPKADEPNKPYEMTADEQKAAQRVGARREGRPFSPRVSINYEDDTHPVTSFKHADKATASAVFMDAMGISEPIFANWYLRQVINVVTVGNKSDADRIDEMIAGVAAMRPRDETEAMLIAQMIATHDLAMTFVRRLKYVENIPQQDSAANALTKLTRTYAAQMTALKHYRTGGEQRVIVQRVDVREGGQAVVGVVNSGKGGEGPERNGGKSHAKQIPDARSAAVLCDVEAEREAVPSSGGAWPADLPNARRD
jgi:hypothetical protein